MSSTTARVMTGIGNISLMTIGTNRITSRVMLIRFFPMSNPMVSCIEILRPRVINRNVQLCFCNSTYAFEQALLKQYTLLDYQSMTLSILLQNYLCYHESPNTDISNVPRNPISSVVILNASIYMKPLKSSKKNQINTPVKQNAHTQTPK